MAWRAQTISWRLPPPPPFLRVWMTTLPLPYLKVWIRHWFLKCFSLSLHVRWPQNRLAFWIPRRGIWTLGTGFRILFQWNLGSCFKQLSGFRIHWAESQIPKPGILDSANKISRIQEPLLSYMGHTHEVVMNCLLATIRCALCVWFANKKK